MCFNILPFLSQLGLRKTVVSPAGNLLRKDGREIMKWKVLKIGVNGIIPRRGKILEILPTVHLQSTYTLFRFFIQPPIYPRLHKCIPFCWHPIGLCRKTCKILCSLVFSLTTGTVGMGNKYWRCRICYSKQFISVQIWQTYFLHHCTCLQIRTTFVMY